MRTVKQIVDEMQSEIGRFFNETKSDPLRGYGLGMHVCLDILIKNKMLKDDEQLIEEVELCHLP